MRMASISSYILMLGPLWEGLGTVALVEQVSMEMDFELSKLFTIPS